MDRSRHQPHLHHEHYDKEISENYKAPKRPTYGIFLSIYLQFVLQIWGEGRSVQGIFYERSYKVFSSSWVRNKKLQHFVCLYNCTLCQDLDKCKCSNHNMTTSPYRNVCYPGWEIRPIKCCRHYTLPLKYIESESGYFQITTSQCHFRDKAN